ncbi:GNAT family N-acetyltransferase [Streptomyces rubrolavendulae]|uniref:Acetyltransferase Pat n=1 Tax=Streptomyces rubrolavendulae TaxID=285473 RepID=A0A1D8GA13_9ACTN|nr:GNAT family N-acetyltransferase [Streptomyces rubrolavendulae]AOT62272.1 Acetyltransferase Pat [Streptomyces rubrolavendulae]
MPGPQRSTHALLADGSTVRVRPAVPEDAPRVLRFYEDLSERTARLRFLATGHRSAELAAARVAEAPGGHRVLVAEAAGRILGIADYTRAPGTTEADIAVAVADDQHHRGLGTLLLEHLADAAREEGITRFTADALAANREMLRVFSDLGLRVTRSFEGPEVHCVIDLAGTDAYADAVDARGRLADVASLRPLLAPRSAAVVGAGRTPGSVGRAVLRNAHRGGFTGPLRAVNPHADTIEQVGSHPSVSALPFVPELAVLAVPAAAVPDVAEECGRAGVRALLVLTSGLTREQGAALLGHCRRHGMRLVGPNCLGLANTAPGVRLNATFAARPALPGTAGVAVQSGGVGVALLDGLTRLGIGVSTFVSLGDKYDVSGNDLLRWWEADGRTELAVLHLESFGNPRAFSRTAPRVARAVPILTVDAGRSEAGRRAAASHTAAAATPTVARQALFAQAGITAARGLGELLDTAALLHGQPLPRGSRVAVVSNAGGAGVLAADACAEAGLTVPALSGESAAQLSEALPGGAVVANPVDATAAVGEEGLRRCVAALDRSPEVDAVLAVLVPTAVAAALGEDLVRALTAPSRALAKPLVAVVPSQGARTVLLPVRGGGHLLVHKSEAGAVALGLRGPEEVRAAYASMARRSGGRLTGVVVQPLAGRGTELLAGVVQDAVFGPLVLFGTGGTATDVLGDHTARLAPLTDVDVTELVGAARCAPLLFGHRTEPADVPAVEQVLLRLSRMAVDLPELAEADLNPVLARPGGATVLDVRVRVEPERAVDPYLRRLR